MSITLPVADPPPHAVRRRVGRPPRLLAAHLPGSILAAARGLFLDKGFAATSLQDIASAAGVTKRTLYVKIGDKEAIFTAVVGDVLREWRHVVEATAPEAAPKAIRDGASGLALGLSFEHLGRQLLAVMLAPDMVRLNRVMLAEAHRFPSLVALLTSQIEQGPIPQLARLLVQARGGTGEPGEEDEVAARLFYDMVVSAPMRVALTGRPPSLPLSTDQWVWHAVRLFLHGWPHAAAPAGSTSP